MNIFRFIYEGTAIAIGAIRANRLRAMLTMLGVAIGIFAITSILTMVNSMKRSVTQNLAEMGNTIMFVHNWPWKFGGDDWYKYMNRPQVSYRDYQKVKNGLKDVTGVNYEVTARRQTIKYSGRSIDNISVIGTNEDQSLLSQFDLSAGRNISEIEFQRGANVCMIGAKVATEMFESEDPIGKQIRIGGKRLTIIGVVALQGISMGPNIDLSCYIPYSAFTRMYNVSRRNIDKVMIIKANDPSNIEAVETELIGLMRTARGLKPSSDDNFSINKQEMLMEQMDKIFSYLDKGGWFISIFSLLIGAFSIGNIMYISVRERTKEIGIQKSLGATRGFILYQFLSEAIIICVLGGLVGLLLVLALTTGVQYSLEQMNVPLSIGLSLDYVLFGVGLSTLIGVLAGLIPSIIATGVDPVVALRFK